MTGHELGAPEQVAVDQNTPEWIEAKLGVPSASKFAAVMTGGDGKVRSKYMRQLAGERITGVQREDFKSPAMERGSAMESELVALYKMLSGCDDVRPGKFFQRTINGRKIGCSPDGVVHGANREPFLLQIKSAAPDVLIEILKADRIPSEHVAQCQGELLVTGLSRGCIAIGYGAMPMFRRGYQRDEAYIARLCAALDQFNRELDDMERWLRDYGKTRA